MSAEDQAWPGADGEGLCLLSALARAATVELPTDDDAYRQPTLEEAEAFATREKAQDLLMQVIFGRDEEREAEIEAIRAEIGAVDLKH